MDRGDNNNVARMNAAARSDNDAERIQVTFSVSVFDQRTLWDSAVMKALSTSSLRIGDLINVIGPREDPHLAECIASLAQPAEIPGCALEDFDVEPARSAQVYTYPQAVMAA